VARIPVLTSQQQSAFNNALQTGIREKDMDVIRLALDNGAEPNLLLFAGLNYKQTWKDTFNAASHGIEWVKAAVDAGADVNAKKHGGGDVDWPALHWAEDNFNTEVLDFLIDRGTPVDTPSPYGDSPLMRAIGKGDETHVRYYLGKGADPMLPCGEKKDTFPLKALEDSGKFRKGPKKALLLLMMQKVKEKAESPPPAAPKAEQPMALSSDIEVSHPVELRHAEAPRPGKSFSL
jgi:hypothetical protein